MGRHQSSHPSPADSETTLSNRFLSEGHEIPAADQEHTTAQALSQASEFVSLHSPLFPSPICGACTHGPWRQGPCASAKCATCQFLYWYYSSRARGGTGELDQLLPGAMLEVSSHDHSLMRVCLTMASETDLV